MPNHLDPALKPAEGFSFNLTDWGKPVWVRFERPDNCMHCGGPVGLGRTHVQQVTYAVTSEENGAHYTVVCYHPECYTLVDGWRKELPHREYTEHEQAPEAFNPRDGEPYRTALRLRNPGGGESAEPQSQPQLPARRRVPRGKRDAL